LFLYPPFLSICYLDLAALVVRPAQAIKMLARKDETEACIYKKKPA
jgi:hypothetical protein